MLLNRWVDRLLLGTVALASCLLAPVTLLADFPTSTPSSGDTLSSSGGGTTAINAPGSTDVTLNIDGAIEPTTSPAVNLGFGATINLTPTGSLHSIPAGGSIGFTLPDIFAGTVVDEATLNTALAPAIGIDSVSGSFASPLIQFAAVNGAATNTVNLIDNQGSIIGSGTAILGANGSANSIILNNGLLATDVSNAAAYQVIGNGNATNFTLTNDSTIATLFNGSTAIDGGGSGSAVSIVSTDSSIFTLGNNSTAIIGGVATNSVFNLELNGRIGRLPTLGTFGNNSPGVVFQGDGNSTGTVGITNAVSNAFGAGLRTLGDDSPLFDISTTPNGTSSFSFSVENSSLSTAGDRSHVFSALAGDGSDILFFFDDASLASTGNDSSLVTYSTGNGSIVTFVGTNSVFSTTGNLSGGIVYLVPAGSNTHSDTTFLGNTSISTSGDDSPAFLIEEGGAVSNRTVTIQGNSTVATQGDRSPGVSIGGLGDSSAIEDSIADLTITTVGDDSPGYFSGGAGTSSAKTTSASNINISTQGDRSVAFENAGIVGTDSVISFDIGNSTLATAGDNSAGLIQRNHPGNNSTAVTASDQLNITTIGNSSPGFVFGEQSAADTNGGPISTGSMTFVNDNTTINTSGNDSAGFIVNGFGDGAAVSDMQLLIENADVTTSGDRSVGVTLNTGPGGGSGSLSTTVVDQVQVRTSGEDSHGFILNSGAGASAGAFTAYQTGLGVVDVETTGDGADGILLGSGLGLNNGVDNTLNIGPGTRAATSGANADALVISENTLVNVGTAVANPTIQSLDNFIATGAGSRSVQNNGTIDGGTTGVVLGAGLRGNIANSGTITSSGPNAVTYDTAANTDDIFELQPGGVVNGNVLAGNGNDQFILGGEGSDTFNHTLVGTQYQGFDEFVKEDGSTWEVVGPDSAAPFIPGTITGGTLDMNANLSGFDMLVAMGGRLEGTGGLGNVTNAGVFSPDGVDNFGVFSVAGDLLLQPGGTLEMDIFAGGQSDLIEVGGVATLGGTLSVNGFMFPAGFPLSNEYIVLTSPGDVIGTFDSVVDNLPDIDAMVIILPSTGPTDPLDPNRPGTVIISYERSGDDSDKSILSNSVQFAGQMGFVFTDTMQRQARQQRYNRCGRSSDGHSFWQTGLGGYHGTESNSTATGYDAGYGGYAIGVDRLVTASDGAVRYGLAAAYIGGSATSGVSTAQVDSAHLGGYANLESGAWLLSGALGYGFLDYDIDRGIPLSGGGSPMVASGKANGGVLTLSLVASYDLAQHMAGATARGIRIAPIARFDYVNARRGEYHEHGATLLDLSVNDARFDSGLVSFGLELGRRVRTSRGTRLNFLYDIRYERVVGRQNTTSVATLTNVGGAPFFAPGAVEQRDRVAIGLGATADVSRTVSTHLRYDTTLGQNTAAHRGSAGVTVRF